MALLNLARFVESRIAPTRFLHSLFLARPIARLFVTIFSCSYFLTEILERNPGYLSWLVEEGTLAETKAFSAYRFELSRQIEPFRDPRRRLNSVKRYFRREMLRIGARDLMGLAGVEEVTAELSFLADAIIETVACMAFEELAGSAGPGETAWSFDAAVPYHRFAVISLGKLGGTELNYSSDIDLMYVCEATEGERERAFYDALARRVTEYLSAPTEEGTLYRVDLRLRPDGDSGPLVVTLADHLNYLQRRAKPWELQSLIKARLSAGNGPVGDAFVDNCAKAIFAPAPSIDPLDEIVTMRERWMTYLSDEERAGNIKLMSGGIRDIEFIAQGIQLMHGRSRPGIRSRNTLESLERLARNGLLSAGAKETLERSYRLFRTVEHRMQMLRNVRTHTLPSAEADLAKTAERVCRSALRGVTPENFTAELGRSLAEVQHLFDGCFKDRVPGEIPLLLSLPASDRAVEDILSKYGFDEGEEAHRFLSALVFGDFPRLEGIETLAAAARSLPGVLERVSLDARSLAHAEEFRADREGHGRGQIDARASRGRRGSPASPARGRLPLDEALGDAREPDRAPRFSRGGSAAGGASGSEGEGRAPARSRAGTRRRSSSFTAGIRFRRTARRFSARSSRRRRSARSALSSTRTAEDARGLALFAAGSLATRSARFGSDLDLIAVTTDERSASLEAGDRPRRHRRRARDPARAGRHAAPRRGGGRAPRPDARLLRGLPADARVPVGDSRVFEVPVRMRRRGNGRAFEEMLARTLPVVFGREGWKARLVESRAKLEALSKGPWDVKHAAGGLYDIDFLLCAARLRGIVEAAPSADRAARSTRCDRRGCSKPATPRRSSPRIGSSGRWSTPRRCTAFRIRRSPSGRSSSRATSRASSARRRRGTGTFLRAAR